MARPTVVAAILGAALLVHRVSARSDETVPRPDSLGERVYNRNCALCHGFSGDGVGAAAPLFLQAPRDFTKGVYKFRSTGSGRLPTDGDLERSVVHGLPGSAMVAQDHLSGREVAAVVQYVKSLSPRFAGAAPPRPLKLPAPVPSERASIERGRQVYVANGCVNCHGDSGRGDGPSAKDVSVPPTDLTDRPLKSGPAAADVVRTIVTGLDGTPMPSYHLVIDDDDVWALAYYVESLGGPPRMKRDESLGWQLEEREPPADRYAAP
jgi:cytochrome c oxidase cbb3-type subunit I/II